jgi:DNA-directed RNA polymerase beta' subunit
MLLAKHSFLNLELVFQKKLDRCARCVIVSDPTLEVDYIKVPRSWIKNVGNKVIFIRHPRLSKTTVAAVYAIPHDDLTIAIDPRLCKVYNADFDGDEVNVFAIRNDENFIKYTESIRAIF